MLSLFNSSSMLVISLVVRLSRLLVFVCPIRGFGGDFFLPASTPPAGSHCRGGSLFGYYLPYLPVYNRSVAIKGRGVDNRCGRYFNSRGR